ncbi:MAG: hypothetical protein Q7P63_10995 [Verrucomicrobiota bacterium JB022]|nr:hypothetical protein [Verrucomicrobiota bacterium JB022]
MSFTLSWYPKGTALRFEGRVDLAEINEANAALWRDPRFDDHCFSLWDLRKGDLSCIEMDQAKVLAAQDMAASLHAPRIRMVFLIADTYTREFTQEYIDYSLRMRTSWDFVIFQTEAEALAWLGLDSLGEPYAGLDKPCP